MGQITEDMIMEDKWKRWEKVDHNDIGKHIMFHLEYVEGCSYCEKIKFVENTFSHAKSILHSIPEVCPICKSTNCIDSVTHQQF